MGSEMCIRDRALSLARIENRFFVALVVIMLGLMPLPNANVSFSTIQYDQTRSKQCQVDVPKPDGTGWGTSFSTLNGKSAQVPVWWMVVHALSKGMAAGAVASIPCGQDLQQLRMEVADLAVNAAGKILRKEISADDQRDLIEKTLTEDANAAN